MSKSSRVHCLFFESSVFCFDACSFSELFPEAVGCGCSLFWGLLSRETGRGTLAAGNCFGTGFWHEASFCACEGTWWEELEGHRTLWAWPLLASPRFWEGICSVTKTRLGPKGTVVSAGLKPVVTRGNQSYLSPCHPWQDPASARSLQPSRELRSFLFYVHLKALLCFWVRRHEVIRNVAS